MFKKLALSSMALLVMTPVVASVLPQTTVSADTQKTTAHTIKAGDNLVYNPDFSLLNSDGSVAGWTLKTYYGDSKVYPNSDAGIDISDTFIGGAPTYLDSDKSMSLTAGKTYEISYTTKQVGNMGSSPFLALMGPGAVWPFKEAIPSTRDYLTTTYDFTPTISGVYTVELGFDNYGSGANYSVKNISVVEQ
ncbi:hypothetical protein ABLU29_02540 [Lactococcus lactis]|uniref:hypothetical protein n=1 Tax=Lactococcus lactis TaxID=1358 RepID=UPI003878026B